MNNADDVNNKCRSCLTMDPLQLFDWNCDMLENLTYMNCFRQCTQLEELEDEPTMLCYSCASELKSTYDFIQKTRESDRELRLKQDTIYTTEESPLDKLELKWLPMETNTKNSNSPVQISEESNDIEKLLNQNKILIAGKGDKSKVKCRKKLPKDKSAKVTKKTRLGRSRKETPAQQSVKLEATKPNVACEYICHICSRIFYDSSTLQMHKLTHEEIVQKEQHTDAIVNLESPPGDMPYQCTHCDMAFNQINKFNNHVRHHGGYRHRCDICEQAYPSKLALSHHSKKHTGLPLKCAMCEKEFRKKSEIRRHIGAVHKVKKIKIKMDKHPVKVEKKRIRKSRVVEVY